MIQGKVWGQTEKIFARNNVQVHRIEGVAGGYCSKHLHERKHNLFYVDSGRLKIEIWPVAGARPDVTHLASGESCSVPPGVQHRFTVIESCVAYEIYWVELVDPDIVREDHGGINRERTHE